MSMTSLRALLRPVKQYGLWRTYLGNILYLQKTRAPLDIVARYIASPFRNALLNRPYLQAQADFRNLTPSLKISCDWFTGRIPFWLSTFEEYKLATRAKVNVLEIGSWEGLSSFFILHRLPNATLTCVDTWQGADEHKAGDAATEEALNGIEMAFDANLSRYKDRLVKYKGTSFSYFHHNPARDVFDVIHVDGSHRCDDVLVDGIKCFEMLKVGGIMIFDDYLWRYYPRVAENPAAAINVFLKLKKGSYRIVRLYYQIIIEKTGDGSH